MGNVSIGDGRTREELNAFGFPAKYLDKGVAVQPIYFYMGHVSRHVRPGSRSVPGLVTQGNTTVGNRKTQIFWAFALMTVIRNGQVCLILFRFPVILLVVRVFT